MEQYRPRTVHYSQFTDLPPDHVFYHEWKAYRRELPRLLAEGHEGKFALIKGDSVIAVFADENEARTVGYKSVSHPTFHVAAHSGGRTHPARSPLLLAMPHFSLPTSPDGLALTVVVGWTSDRMVAVQAAGQPIPAPISVRSLIDTGTDVTVLTPKVLLPLGVPLFRTTSTHTLTGPANVTLFEISLTMFGPQGAGGPALVRPRLVVMESPNPLPNVEVLLGMDVLSECLLLVDGPGRQFTLAF